MTAEREWIKLYRAALRETDPDKQPARVEEAKRAMKQALRMAVEYEDSDQRHAISEAKPSRKYSAELIILCSSVRLCRIMLLALGLQAEFSLKLLHDSCGLRLMPNVRQQCSERHSQHQHSEQQQNIRHGTHNRRYSSKAAVRLNAFRVVRKSEQITLWREF